MSEEEKIGMDQLGEELAKALDAEEEPKGQPEAEEQATKDAEPILIDIEGQKLTPEQIVEKMHLMHRDYTEKTQTAAEQKRQAEETLRSAQALYEAAQMFAQQKAEKPEEPYDEPYITPQRHEQILQKAIAPLKEQVTALTQAQKEAAITAHIETLCKEFPNANPKEILIESIAMKNSTGQVDMREIAKQSHLAHSASVLTEERKLEIYKEMLAKEKEKNSKQVISPDSGKAPPMEPEKLKFNDTEAWLKAQLEKGL